MDEQIAERHVIQRTGDKDLVFTGEMLADVEGVHIDELAHVRIYQTAAGRLVAAVLIASIGTSHATAAVLDSPAELTTWLCERAGDQLAKRALREAGFVVTDEDLVPSVGSWVYAYETQ